MDLNIKTQMRSCDSQDIQHLVRITAPYDLSSRSRKKFWKSLWRSAVATDYQPFSN
jgi:hypothetical protein